ALDVARLTLDRGRQFVEGVPIFRDYLSVFAADTFSRQDDRGERVLDLVRNSAGDIGPGRRALRGDELGDVVEGHDGPLLFPAVHLAGEADGEDALVPVLVDELHLMLHAVGEPVLAFFQQGTDFRNGFLKRLTDQ